ncbi:type II toxin-antitoxin system Phd/YefM family antitoxin [Streptomyces globisporus]|uniref:type II toxin-antitoxin system Phd/YefM family antitoxin n=1 Tax=Streptomyces globisporus TaxID=1908 RepID=UPI00368FB3C7
MATYNAKDMRSKAGQMLDEARRGEGVVIMRRGAERFVLRYEPEGAHPNEHQGDSSVNTPASDDLLGQILGEQAQTNVLLRELVEQGKGDRALDQIIEKSQPTAEARPSTVTVQIPEKPVVSPDPSQGELEVAYDCFGLRSTPDGFTITEKGLRSASATVKKAARQDPESAEAKVMRMGSADDERVEFLLCVQVDKLSKALAKKAAGDPHWLGVATP